MPLVPIYDSLKRAQAGKYALPLFDAFDANSADGMLEAIEECNAPAIVAIYTPYLLARGGKALAAYVAAKAQECKTPVSLMLDHGASFEVCMLALGCGFTDVMYDGSQLPLEENIANTRMVVRAAHTLGAGVEAELGHVGMGTDYAEVTARRAGFTDPAEAERFVNETGIDFLAVAIGSAHGPYHGQPQLDLDLLAEIAARVPTPLVMHGGSGLAAEQFQAAIVRGICKVNIATDLYQTTTDRMLEAARSGNPTYLEMGQCAAESFRERCEYYLRIFGAAGKGG